MTQNYPKNWNAQKIPNKYHYSKIFQANYIMLTGVSFWCEKLFAYKNRTFFQISGSGAYLNMHPTSHECHLPLKCRFWIEKNIIQNMHTCSTLEMCLFLPESLLNNVFHSFRNEYLRPVWRGSNILVLKIVKYDGSIP